MIPLTTLYDDYIYRPFLTEQKKPIWVYSSSPTKVGRNKKPVLVYGSSAHKVVGTIMKTHDWVSLF